MGPRFFKRGELPEKSRPLKQLELQWGHAFSSVERLRGQRRQPSPSGFNGATLFQAWREFAPRSTLSTI